MLKLVPGAILMMTLVALPAITQAADRPDSDLTITSGKLTPGRITFTIKNLVNANPLLDGPKDKFGVGLQWMKSNGTTPLDAPFVFNLTRAISSGALNADTSRTYTYTSPSSLHRFLMSTDTARDPGATFLRVSLDTEKKLNDKNTLNDSILLKRQLPDLDVTSLSYGPRTNGTTQHRFIKFRIKNNNSHRVYNETNNKMKVRLEWRTNTTAVGPSYTFEVDTPYLNQAAGYIFDSSRVNEANSWINTNMPADAYRIGISVDVDNVIMESNEVNNSKRFNAPSNWIILGDWRNGV